MMNPLLLDIPFQIETKDYDYAPSELGDGIIVNNAIRESISSRRKCFF